MALNSFKSAGKTHYGDGQEIAVASGVLDGWCDMHDNGHGVWDYLASVVIIEAAGGVAAEVFGRDLCILDHTARRAPVVAATPELLGSILAERLRA